jgi:KR domain/Polyketide synthase dehydratase
VLEASGPPGFAIPGLLGGRIEVVEDEQGIGAEIAARLAARGVDAKAVAKVSADATGVVFARGVIADDSADAQDRALAVQRDALDAARTLAKQKGPRLFVTVQDTGGDFATSGRAGDRAWGGGLPGLAKTAAGEWPDAAVKAIDVATNGATAASVADRVVAELLLGGRDVEVALRSDGTRAIVRHRAAPYRPVAARIRQGSVLIVSGGARGVTATSLAALCQDAPKLALLGRTALVDEGEETRGAATDAELRRALLARSTATGTPLPPKELAREAKLILDCREIRDNIAALERAGAEVSYHAIDVRSADSVRTCVDGIRDAWGPIHGIIHGAGVLADALLTSQTDEQYDRVFGTKVDGLRHLLSATASDPIELLILFASVAGRFGNSAQAAYAMANEVLSTVAANERAKRPGCLVRALAWGPWAGGMVTPGLAKLFEKAGVQLIALDVGAEALAREIRSDDGTAQVVLMNGEPPLTAKPMQGGHTFDGTERFDVVVNDATYPQLAGHRIGGVPVVPAVLAVEWFLRAAIASFPSLTVRTCRDVKVLRGVPVDHFEQHGVRLAVQLRVQSATAHAATLEMKLVDEHEKLRYAAVVEMGVAATPDSTDASAGPESDAETSGQASTWPIDAIYSEVLFHRAPFAGIRELGPVFDTGTVGEVAGLRAAGWPDASWATDPALLDAGLQMACVWGRHVLGGVPLPTSFGAVDVFHHGPVDAPVRCVLRGRRAGQRKVVVELTFATPAGVVLGRIRDLEMHLPPSLEATSRPDHPAAGAADSNGAA